MDIEDALQAADRLATRNGVGLGSCLFESPIGDGDWWLLNFDIIGGPPVWCWLVVVNDARQGEEFFAIRHKPSPSLTPRIRRWWLFGRRRVKLPYR
jgi:hypothetical protein